jgi:hypothetical protein
MSPVDSEEDLTGHFIKAAATWQFLSTHINLCCVPGLMDVHLNLAKFGHGTFLHSVYSISCTIVMYLGRIKVRFELDVKVGLY